MNPETVHHISECFIKPHHLLDEAKQPIYLGPWDLAMLSVHYIQKGLLFKKTPLSNNQENPIETLIENLKESLSATLVHFYPFAGRLTTLKQENPQTYSVYIDCNNSPGARFVQASVNLTTALLWRCVTRIRCVPHDGITKCTMMINNRSRLYPPLSQNYFGSVVQSVGGMTTAGELLAHELGWAARLLNQAVVGHDDKAVRDYVESWLQSPTVSQLGQLYHPYNIRVGTTSRFDMYGNEFGLGKAVAIRSGSAAKFDGKLTLYPGQEGGGSMDLEMCLSPDSMRSVECDEEFLDALTFSNQMH